MRALGPPENDADELKREKPFVHPAFIQPLDIEAEIRFVGHRIQTSCWFADKRIIQRR
jgi:hypothetical protein